MLGYARLLTWRHRREARRLGRRRRALERVEPFALGLLDGDAVLPRADDAPALNELLTGMAPTITGESRQAIADYFLSTGELDRAIAGLGDRRWPVRAAHAASLGDMCHARAEPALIERLGDGHPEVRLAAARSLGRLRSREAAEPLAEALVAGAVPRAVATASLLAIGAAVACGGARAGRRGRSHPGRDRRRSAGPAGIEQGRAAAAGLAGKPGGCRTCPRLPSGGPARRRDACAAPRGHARRCRRRPFERLRRPRWQWWAIARWRRR